MLSEHCRVISDQDHAFAGRRREKEKYVIYLELYPALMLKSHILPVAAPNMNFSVHKSIKWTPTSACCASQKKAIYEKHGTEKSNVNSESYNP